MSSGDCFGFYNGDWRCTSNCRSMTQCKALVNSDGLDVVSDVLEELTEGLTDRKYRNSPFMRVNLAQILSPDSVVGATITRNAVEEELLNQLGLAQEDK